MAKPARSLSGRVVAITGAGRGIGAATARALARKGARVAIGDLDLESAERTAAELGGDAIALRLDVTDRPGFAAFLDDVEERLGPIDVLINNAGIMPVTRIDDETDASVTRQLELNVHSVIFGTKEAVRRMRPRGTGHIVNIASTAGKGGFPGIATYCGCKHAVVGFSEAVRGEIRGSGIEVSCVMPALVKTELTSGIEDSRAVKRATPEDVADAIVGALERPHFDVFVPKKVGRMAWGLNLLPRAGREAVVRALKADRIMLDAANSQARSAYEARAAASAPAVEEMARDTAGA